MMSTIDLSSGRAVDTVMLGGKPYHRLIGDRASVRHAVAIGIELGTRADVADRTEHPYKNWGYEHYLEWVLTDREEGQ
jgi:hypothetical protein